jgi:hypothetical protein
LGKRATGTGQGSLFHLQTFQRPQSTDI